MGKIYKLSNGKTVTVLPEDESDFLQKIKEQGLTATLELNPNTEYDTIAGGLTKKELAKSKLKNFSQKLKNTKERAINWLNPKVDQWGEAKDAEPEVVEPLDRELDLTNITSETPDSMLQDINVTLPQLNKYDYNGKTYVKIQAPGLTTGVGYDEKGLTTWEGQERIMQEFFVLESEAKDKGLNFNNIDGTEINIPEVQDTFGWTEIYGMDSVDSFRPYTIPSETWDNAPEKSTSTTDTIVSNDTIPSYTLGDGYDFAWTTPNQFLNLNNASDYWN